MAFKIRSFVSIALLLAVSIGCQSRTEVMDVTVALDFGPTGRQRTEKRVSVPERSTVLEALKQAFPVVTSGR